VLHEQHDLRVMRVLSDQQDHKVKSEINETRVILVLQELLDQLVQLDQKDLRGQPDL
jgi:hypothetical protein